jgi:hypothetical protein
MPRDVAAGMTNLQEFKSIKTGLKNANKLYIIGKGTFSETQPN